jgi:6-pyruvoyltetrahydropterin/6-carboxytetrahydropterin synthase
MGKFTSTKVFDGFSTVFRQWRAKGTHCSYLHGYGVSFKVWFEGTLDGRNWVWDFGGMKRAKGTINGMSPKAWMDYMFDHTLIIAEDDPFLPEALKLDEAGIAQVRIVEATGAEKFSQFIYEKIAPFVEQETEGRVRVTKVEFREHEKNSAQYGE